ncbi:MAG: glycosyltransferase family 2 protein [Fervidobacterium sp.]
MLGIINVERFKLNDEEPLISYVIPAYNVEKYISKTLESILAQTFRNSEVIVVNDGSKDKTSQIVKETLNKKVSWTVINQQNSGVSIARNVGIKYSNGKYIRFIDGDDIVPEQSTEKLYKTLVSVNANISFGKFVMKTSKGRQIMISDELGRVDGSVVDKIELIKNFLTYKPFIHLGNILFEKKIIVENNIWFTPGVKIAEDFEFIAKLFYYSKKIAFCDDYVYYWLYRKSSATKTKSLSMFHYVGVMRRLRKFFLTLNANELVVHIENYSLPLAYTQTLGILAYNKLNYIDWRKITSRKDIEKYIHKTHLDTNNSVFHSKMAIIKNAYHLSPALPYVIMRMARKYHELL